MYKMTKNRKNPITPAIIQQAENFDESLRRMESLIRDKQNTIPNETESYLQLIKLNFHRMKRVYKTTCIHDELRDVAINFPTHIIWIVITNPRCGDSAQSIPVMQRIAELNDKIQLKIILMDDHPEVMDSYLTNGARAIPKLICLNADTLEELGTWGPRPEPMQMLLREHKNNPVLSKSEFSELIQRKYLEDKTTTIQNEYLELLKSWSRQIKN